MNKYFFFIIFTPALAYADVHQIVSKIEISKLERIHAENIQKIYLQAKNRQLETEAAKKTLKEVNKSILFEPFKKWLESLVKISSYHQSTDLINFCYSLEELTQTISLEKKLEKQARNYCRDRSLKLISQESRSTKTLRVEQSEFIEKNLKYFLSSKNKNNFATFLNQFNPQSETIKSLSKEIIEFSSTHNIVPSGDILKDIVLDETLTSLIQDKGFNYLQHKNVFYAEFSKLIETGYSAISKELNEATIIKQVKHLKNYYDLNSDHLPVNICLTRINDFSKALFRAGLEKEARDLFKFVINKDRGEIKEDALFSLMWTYIFKGDLDDALDIAEDYRLLTRTVSISDPRLRFWVGLLLEEDDQIKKAVDYYEKTVQQSPLSFYGIMASKKLKALSPQSPEANYYEKQVTKKSNSIDLKLELLNPDYVMNIKRLKIWATMDSQKMMANEVKRLKSFAIPNQLNSLPQLNRDELKSSLHLINSLIIQKSSNHLTTFKYIYEVLDSKEVEFNRDLLEVLYPSIYIQEVSKALQGESLDPYVLLSLIRQESVFNPMAQSRVGARGLMQLMPATAKRFKKGVREKQLNNPELNISIGSKYFNGLLKRYNGNLIYSLAAYNAGESRVDRWKGNLFNEDALMLRNIEAIPFLETRNYVKLIFRNLFFYKLLKSDQKDTQELNKIFNQYLGFKR